MSAEDSAAGAAAGTAVRTVEFHRDFHRFQGGHLKVFHYFGHVRSSPRYEPRIRFSADSVWDESNPWLRERRYVLGPDEQISPDVLFLAGVDWRAIDPARRADSPVPIVNLIQGFRHLRAANPAYEFLAHRAIRLCVSEQIEQALREHGAPGPIFTVPIGLDAETLPAPAPAEQRDIDCVVLAIKHPQQGRSLGRSLRSDGRRVLVVDDPLPRAELLEAMARARVTVHLPVDVEGAYLPALESMALGALVVCPDCVGNRSFCRDGDTCLVPEREQGEILQAARLALSETPEALAPMLQRGREQAAAHSLSHERERFLSILDRAQELWSAG